MSTALATRRKTPTALRPPSRPPFDEWLKGFHGIINNCVRSAMATVPRTSPEDLKQEAWVTMWRVYRRRGHQPACEIRGYARKAIRHRFHALRRMQYRAAHRGAWEDTEVLGDRDATIPDATDMHEVETRILIEQIDRTLARIDDADALRATRDLWENTVPLTDGVGHAATVPVSLAVTAYARRLGVLHAGGRAAALRLLLHPSVEMLSWIRRHSSGRSRVEVQRALLAEHFGCSREEAEGILCDVLIAVMRGVGGVSDDSSLPLVKVQSFNPNLLRRERTMSSDPFLDAMSEDATAADTPKAKKVKKAKAAVPAAQEADQESAGKEATVANGTKKQKVKKGAGKGTATAKTGKKAEAKGKKAKAEKKEKGTRGAARKIADADRVVRTGEDGPREGTTRRVIYDLVPSNDKGIAVASLVEKAMANKKALSPRGGTVGESKVRRRILIMAKRGWVKIEKAA